VSGPIRLSQLDLWEQRRRACLEVLASALASLPRGSSDEPEDDVNRRLFFCIDRATHARMQLPGCLVGAIAYEARNSPSVGDAERAAREMKRPDFVWAWIDDLAPDPAASRREFVVECKRLAPQSGRWRFTRNYITEGVARFIAREHGYGKDMRSGAMVGYLQKIGLAEALSQVNTTATALAIPVIQLRSADGEAGAVLDHEVTRSFAETPFRLDHVWTRLA
jgi:hypothetical protein